MKSEQQIIVKTSDTMSEALQYILVFTTIGLVMLAMVAKVNKEDETSKERSKCHRFCFKKTFREDSEVLSNTSDDYQKI